MRDDFVVFIITHLLLQVIISVVRMGDIETDYTEMQEIHSFVGRIGLLNFWAV